ncbi:leucyl aminopeptidase [Actinobacillus equuli]|nr:leucyl aminopeptidase [Actinobacillus equuli]
MVVGVYEPRRLSAAADQLDKLSEGYISTLLRRGDLEGKAGQTLCYITYQMYLQIAYCLLVAEKNES